MKKETISKEQQEILVGLILGDGHLETRTNGKTYRLKVEHSSKQKPYVDWLFEIFSNLAETIPRERTRVSLGKEMKSHGFTTRSVEAFRLYGKQFYHNGKKMIPEIISTLLTPRSLAIWFMDDGSYKSSTHKTYIIHSNGYAREELEMIQVVLKEKFGITVGIHKQYFQWRLYVYTASAPLFRKIIEPYIIPSMQYKLGVTQMPKK
jgi:recombination protein RecA